MDITNNKSLYDSMSAKLIKATVYCLLAMLSACSSTPDSETQQNTSDAEQLLSLANAQPNSAATLRLQAARIYLNKSNFPASLSSLDSINLEQLNNDALKANFLFLQSVNNVQLKTTEAIKWLEQMSSYYLALLPLEDQWLWQQNHATALAQNDRLVDALNLLEHQRPLLTRQQSIDLSTLINQLLVNQDHESLSSSAEQTTDPIIQGWIKLALILNNESADNYKRVAFDQWKSHYPEHPAQLKLPDAIAKLPNYVQQEINSIALLLPLKGKFANVSKSITDGFLLAAYQQPLETRPEIIIIDSTQGDFLTLYQTIEADLIVGPLNRDNIKKLANLPQLNTPTIALNALDSDTTPVNLFVMNLQSEDEAKTMAKFASQTNFKTGAILTYQSKKGDKLAKTFEAAFNSEGRTIAHTQSFEKNWATSIQKTLEIDKSNHRARNLSRLLRSPIEFTARRREDIEFIYAPLKYKDLRQTNPLMAFYFADDIQVLSNSDITAKLYSGKKDKDLNDIVFADFSWDPSKLNITSLPSKNDSSAKLYSWGADAFTAAIQLPILLAMQNQQLKGFSSTIYYNGNSEIIREFPVSYVRYGKPYAKTAPTIQIN